MNTLPPELHSVIFSLSCTDAGYTSRSLSQVSTYFREIAAPLLYRTLSLSARQLHALVEKLEKTSPRLRHVHHLFVTDAESKVPFDTKTVLRLLSLTSPTLTTFALVSTNPQTGVPILGRIFRMSFPSLKELWVSGYYPFPTSPSMFPSLKRLHLNGNRNPHGLLQTGNLDESCPSLSHLYISGLSMAVTFALELESALNTDASSLFPSTLPSSLKSVVVQAGLALDQGGKTAKLKDELMELHLVRMMSAPVVNGVAVSLLPRKAVGVEEVRGEWLDALCRDIVGDDR
ncbi:hypothetical protein BDQ17DRAFT_1098288 [Cyathus striatus]|nr:hypothetical protein BDQ17DRAFT_1098288 [Cyathus striatus]